MYKYVPEQILSEQCLNTAATLLIKTEQNQEKITTIYLPPFFLYLKPQVTLIIFAETHEVVFFSVGVEQAQKRFITSVSISLALRVTVILRYAALFA